MIVVCLAYVGKPEYIQLINDTEKDLYISLADENIFLPKDKSTYLPCKEGKKVYESDGKKKGSLIFIIEKRMCNKTIKISAYL